MRRERGSQLRLLDRWSNQQTPKILYPGVGHGPGVHACGGLRAGCLWKWSVTQDGSDCQARHLGAERARTKAQLAGLLVESGGEAV